MATDSPTYYIAVETFYPCCYEPTSSNIRVRPLEGQGVSTDLRVEFSKKRRDLFPVGTVFVIEAKLTDRQGGSFIYSYFGWSYATIDRDVAIDLIDQKKLGFFSTAMFTGLYSLKPLGAKIYFD